MPLPLRQAAAELNILRGWVPPEHVLRGGQWRPVMRKFWGAKASTDGEQQTNSRSSERCVGNS